MQSFHCDNRNAILIAHSDFFHQQIQCIESECNFIRQHILRNLIRLVFVILIAQTVDVSTKTHSHEKFCDLSGHEL